MCIIGGGGAPGGLGRDFWWVFAASTLTVLVNGASTPLLARYALDDLGAAPGIAGVVVGSSSVAAILLRPSLGRLADRFGLRRATIVGCLVAASGALVLMAATTVGPGTFGRILSGVGTAAANTALTAWVIDLVPLKRRGRALGIFGVSIWTGLAVGPQIGQILVATAGYGALWIACMAMPLLAALCVARTAAPPAVEPVSHPSRDPLRLLRLVARPGAAAAIAWAGEGLILTFLVVDLEARGLSGDGLTGAATVFTVFAISVIGGRLALADLVDRVGPEATAAAGLVTVGCGLGVLAIAMSFPVAAAGAVLLGIGFAPLFPALALIATRHLDPRERASGVGFFAAFMDAGIALGSILGGVLVTAIGAGGAIGTVAALQLLAALLVVGPRSGPRTLE